MKLNELKPVTTGPGTKDRGATSLDRHTASGGGMSVPAWLQIRGASRLHHVYARHQSFAKRMCIRAY